MAGGQNYEEKKEIFSNIGSVFGVSNAIGRLRFLGRQCRDAICPIERFFFHDAGDNGGRRILL